MSSKNSRDEWRPPSVASTAADYSSTKEFIKRRLGKRGDVQGNPHGKLFKMQLIIKIDELTKQARILKDAAHNVHDAIKDNTVVDENLLKESVERCEEVLQKLEELYAQDKCGDNLADADRIRQSAYINLKNARTAATLDLMAEHKMQQDDNASRTSRRSNRKSYKSSQHSTSSSLRAKVIAEAAAAKAQAEYDRLLAEKEHQRRQHELEEQRLMDQRRAQYDKEIALITVDIVAAIADAKLDAIER
jgi:hypothetical protein